MTGHTDRALIEMPVATPPPQPEGAAPTVCLIGGTRPEAIKIAPVVRAMRAAGRLHPIVLASGQHPTSFTHALAAFGEAPDIELAITRHSGTQPELAAALVAAFDAQLSMLNPSAVLVQGDTTTALIAAMVAFWRRIAVVHLEAGLRSGDLRAPFPEEANRALISRITNVHLAPTPRAARNLQREGIGGDVWCVGNTVVDAALTMAHIAESEAARPAASGPLPGRLRRTERRLAAATDRARRGRSHLVLATAHRRESWGDGLDHILAAMNELADGDETVEIVFPAHPNAEVAARVHRALDHRERIIVTPPLDYPRLIQVLSVATLVCSDSGGIQEEAPTFGVPVLVLRDVTERTEAVEAGTATLVGTDAATIVAHARAVLDGGHRFPIGRNPFGDGHASERTEQAVAWLLGRADHPPAAFRPAIGRPAGQRRRRAPLHGLAMPA